MFAHLHTHSEYSLLDGLSKIPDLVQRAQDLGQQSLAITDHGVMYGAIELYETARAHDIRPIIGLEAYVAAGSRLGSAMRHSCLSEPAPSSAAPSSISVGTLRRLYHINSSGSGRAAANCASHRPAIDWS